MEFEWDDAKEARNLRIHGIDFEEAETAFYDPLSLVTLDTTHSTGEHRFVLLGHSTRGRLLVTVFTERGSRTRIVSCRRATRREVKSYEEGV